MKPVLKNGRLAVELHKPDIAKLESAREIGRLLAVIDSSLGGPLAETITATLVACGVESKPVAEEGDGDEQ